MFGSVRTGTLLARRYSFDVTSLTPSVEEMILTGFRAERDEECTGFCERCDALLAELSKLEAWLAKSTTRDFVVGSQKQPSLDKFAQCRVAYDAFAKQVYSQQGIDPTESGER